MNVSVIIPSLNPDEKLVAVVEAVIKEGFTDVILVNDGSDSDHLWPFEKVSKYKECTILTHEVNKGKGRGLKTAFEYCINNRPDIDGVVTVDGDNQHKADDIMNCSRVMVETGNVVLGSRDFSGDDVPKRSKMGNNLTSGVFKVLCRLKISDTQTGLRAIPKKYLQTLCEVEGERFEYETNMLLSFKRYHIGFQEETIKTVYIEENASSHFNPVKDSIKIYKVILKYVFGGTGFKYTLSSIASWIIDNALFNLLHFLLFALSTSMSLLLSTGIARAVSSVFNYVVNRNAVFKSKEGIKKTALKYYILCAIQLACSYGLVFLASVLLLTGNLLSEGTVLFWTGVIKIVVDLFLFLASYQIQKKWVFK